jgi:hypothetical protein
MEHKRHARIASGLNILAGLWIIASPQIFHYATETQSMWNSTIVGLIIAAIGLVRFILPDRVEGLSWVGFLAGLWTIISPFIFLYPTMASTWNSIIAGVVVAVLASTSVRETRLTRSSRRAAAM